MGHGPHQARCSSTRKPGIRVEGNYVANARDHFRRMAADGYEGSVQRVAKKLIELVEFSALALPSHPFLFRLIPHALTVEYEEAVTAAGRRTVARVQSCDGVDS